MTARSFYARAALMLTLVCALATGPLLAPIGLYFAAAWAVVIATVARRITRDPVVLFVFVLPLLPALVSLNPNFQLAWFLLFAVATPPFAVARLVSHWRAWRRAAREVTS